MSLLSIAFAFAWHHRVATACTSIGIALATALVLLVLHLRRDVEEDILRQGGTADLVVGEPGSEAGLVLSSVLHVGTPRGTVPYRDFLDLLREPGVTHAFPFCIGDSVQGSPIVGTTTGFLEQVGAQDAPVFELAEGRHFENDFEMVVGSAVAKRLGLVVGDKLVTTHGLAGQRHEDCPYNVVGILAPTGTAHDRAIFTTLGSYWKAHKAPTEPDPTQGDVSAILVQVQRPRLLQIQTSIQDKFGLMAVRPAEVLEQISDEILSPVERVLFAYGAALAIVAAGSILATLYLTTLVRRRDHAILRSLGASPREIFTIVLFEAMIQSVLGCGLGVILSRVALWILRSSLRSEYGLTTTLFDVHPAEALAIIAVLALGALAALYPAWRAYRSDVAANLRRG